MSYSTETYNDSPMDIQSLEKKFDNIEYKLNKIIKMLAPVDSAAKELSEIPFEEKAKMKVVLEESFTYLSQWELDFLKSMIHYPRWSTKQEHNWNKILSELSTRKGE